MSSYDTAKLTKPIYTINNSEPKFKPDEATTPIESSLTNKETATNPITYHPNTIWANFDSSGNHQQTKCRLTLNTPAHLKSIDIISRGSVSEQPLTHIKIKYSPLSQSQTL